MLGTVITYFDLLYVIVSAETMMMIEVVTETEIETRTESENETEKEIVRRIGNVKEMTPIKHQQFRIC